jgi:hypothetical protein
MPHDDLDEFLTIQGGGSLDPRLLDDEVEPRWGCDVPSNFRNRVMSFVEKIRAREAEYRRR